ncbi:MAG: hypothetical protein H2043_06570 [Rhizobiales bacterium]|nr:hypothetical protein [Hyphomicrobiales bacterium]
MIEFRSNPQPKPAPHLSCRQVVVNRIADVIREMQGSSEPVTEEALIARNIPLSVVERYKNEALDVVRRAFIKRV